MSWCGRYAWGVEAVASRRRKRSKFKVSHRTALKPTAAQFFWPHASYIGVKRWIHRRQWKWAWKLSNFNSTYFRLVENNALIECSYRLCCLVYTHSHCLCHKPPRNPPHLAAMVNANALLFGSVSNTTTRLGGSPPIIQRKGAIGNDIHPCAVNLGLQSKLHDRRAKQRMKRRVRTLTSRGVHLLLGPFHLGSGLCTSRRFSRRSVVVNALVVVIDSNG